MADWSINVPLSDLADLQSMPGRMKDAELELKRQRSEIIGLRNQLSEVLMLLSDLRKEMRKGKQAG